MNKRKIKEKIKKFLLKGKFTTLLLVLFRKIRLLVFSYKHLPRLVAFKFNGKKLLEFNTRNWAVANFCKNNVVDSELNYEPVQSKVFVLIARNSRIVFDIGTQIGYYAILAAKLGAEKVFAFDVDKSFLRVALKNAERNKVYNKIKFIRKAISNKDGEIVSIENYSGKSLVKTISLDSFCLQNQVWPDFVKMDIEGFELESLEGAPKLLEHKPIILLAFHPKFIQARNRPAERVLLLLLDNGFSFYAFTRNGLREVSLNPDNLAQLLNRETGDFLCLPDSFSLPDSIKSLFSN